MPQKTPENEDKRQNSLTASSKKWASQSQWEWFHSSCSLAILWRKKEAPEKSQSKLPETPPKDDKKRNSLTVTSKMWASQSEWESSQPVPDPPIAFTQKDKSDNVPKLKMIENESMAVKQDRRGSSQPIDFSSGSTFHAILTTKTFGRIPTKSPFLS